MPKLKGGAGPAGGFDKSSAERNLYYVSPLHLAERGLCAGYVISLNRRSAPSDVGYQVGRRRPRGKVKEIMGDHKLPKEWETVGERLRLAREAAGISVRELARRVDVSASHVSLVERGLASFSVRSLYKVVSILAVSMDSLFQETRTPSQSISSGVPDKADVTPYGGPLDESGIVLRRGNRPTLQLQSGPRWERLTAKPEDGFNFIEVVYAAGPSNAPPEDYPRHSGREYTVILSGILHVQVGFGESQLGPGDSIAFNSQIPHRFWNSNEQEVRAVRFLLDVPAAADEELNTDRAEGRRC